MLISVFRSGNFEISIYNSLDKEVRVQWDEMKSETLRSPYLCFLEESNSEDLNFRYVILEEKNSESDNKVCAIIYFQHLKFTKKNIHFSNSFFLSALASIVLLIRPFHFLICGNLFAVNFPAIDFKKDKIMRDQLLEILSEIQRREKPDVFILKDLENDFDKSCMERFGWSPYLVDLTMELTIDASWNSMEDYFCCLTKKYKRRAEKIIEAGNRIVKKELNAENILSETKQIKNLFNQVTSKQTIKMGLIGENYFYEYKKKFPDEFSFWGYYFENRLVAFTTYIEHGKTLEIHYIGINYSLNKELMIYFNILFDGIQMAIVKKKEQLELGRTAREAKANIGGKSLYFNDFISVKGWLANVLAKKFTKYFQSEIGEDWAERHPFRK